MARRDNEAKPFDRKGGVNLSHSKLQIRRPFLCFALGLFLLLSAFSPGRLISWDVAVRLVVTRALLTEGKVAVPASHEMARGLVEGPRGWTSFYGIGQSLAFLPFDALGYGIGLVSGLKDKALGHVELLPLIFLYAPLVGIWWWAALAGLLRAYGVSERKALFFATLFSLSTILFVYSSQTLQEEALVGALITSALVSALGWARDRDRRSSFCMGLLMGAAFLTRPTSGLAFLPIAGLIFDALKDSHRRIFKTLLPGAAAGLSIGLILYFIFAYWRFGSPFSTGYDLLIAQRKMVFWRPFSPQIAWGLLFGFGKGMFLLSPPLWLALVGYREAWKKNSGLWTGWTLAVLGSVVVHALRATDPDGSECWGARYQVHLVGFMVVPFYFGVQKLKASGVGKVLVGICLLSGVLIQIAGTMAPDAIEYTQSDAVGAPRAALISSFEGGHLPRRVKNIFHWMQSQPLSPELNAETQAKIEEMRMKYLPNQWGPAYAKKASTKGAALALSLLWLMQILAGLSFLRLGIKAK